MQKFLLFQVYYSDVRFKVFTGVVADLKVTDCKPKLGLVKKKNKHSPVSLLPFFPISEFSYLSYL